MSAEPSLITLGQASAEAGPAANPHRYLLAAKRLFDLTVATAILITTAPLLALVGGLICLESRGHPFFVDMRCGKDERAFRMIKFRTMHQGASQMRAVLSYLNDADEPLFKIKSDPRVTRVGKVLRRWRIDELPQLINVVRGEMSLIGPRPFVVAEATILNIEAGARVQMRPGMTGPWQVSGGVQLATEELIRLDVDYVNNWSFWRDMKLIAATARAVIVGDGAY